MSCRKRSWEFPMEQRRSSSDTHFFLFSVTASQHPWYLQWSYWYESFSQITSPIQLASICKAVKFFIIVQASKKPLDPVAPLHKYGVVSISNILTTTCQYEVGFVLVLYLFCHLCCFVLLIYWICNMIISGPQVCQFPCPNACQMCEDDTCDGNLCYTLTSAVKSIHLSIHFHYIV